MASELCTVVDYGTISGRRGSLAIDDEGVPGQYNVLIENGILKGFMQDKMNARLMGLIGGSFFYGEVVITPAISVMSAIEGCTVRTTNGSVTKVSASVIPIGV